LSSKARDLASDRQHYSRWAIRAEATALAMRRPQQGLGSGAQGWGAL